MATTLTDMINEVSINLSGYTLQQDRATHITADVAATASTIAAPITLTLASTDSVGKGIVEIDEELFWIDNYDRVGNTATIAPYGRAYLGTTLAAHTAGTKVTVAPTFPRFVIKKAINDTITAIGSSIFAANTTTITSNAAVSAFRLPATGNSLNIRNILAVAYQSLGASKEWIPLRTWRFDGNANSTAFTSGQSISIYDFIPSGRTVQIAYATDPVAFPDLATTALTNAQVFETVSGLPASCKDLVILGATYRLLSNLDPARASMVSPQADETDSKRPYGSSQSITRQIFALFTQRLAEEVKNQQDKYPIRVHYSL
jgi:hypothetical protein